MQRWRMRPFLWVGEEPPFVCLQWWVQPTCLLPLGQCCLRSLSESSSFRVFLLNQDPDHWRWIPGAKRQKRIYRGLLGINMGASVKGECASVGWQPPCPLSLKVCLILFSRSILSRIEDQRQISPAFLRITFLDLDWNKSSLIFWGVGSPRAFFFHSEAFIFSSFSPKFLFGQLLIDLFIDLALFLVLYQDSFQK